MRAKKNARKVLNKAEKNRDDYRQKEHVRRNAKKMIANRKAHDANF